MFVFALSDVRNHIFAIAFVFQCWGHSRSCHTNVLASFARWRPVSSIVYYWIVLVLNVEQHNHLGKWTLFMFIVHSHEHYLSFSFNTGKRHFSFANEIKRLFFKSFICIYIFINFYSLIFLPFITLAVILISTSCKNVDNKYAT